MLAEPELTAVTMPLVSTVATAVESETYPIVPVPVLRLAGNVAVEPVVNAKEVGITEIVRAVRIVLLLPLLSLEVSPQPVNSSIANTTPISLSIECCNLIFIIVTPVFILIFFVVKLL